MSFGRVDRLPERVNVAVERLIAAHCRRPAGPASSVMPPLTPRSITLPAMARRTAMPSGSEAASTFAASSGSMSSAMRLKRSFTARYGSATPVMLRKRPVNLAGNHRRALRQVHLGRRAEHVAQQSLVDVRVVRHESGGLQRLPGKAGNAFQSRLHARYTQCPSTSAPVDCFSLPALNCSMASATVPVAPGVDRHAAGLERREGLGTHMAGNDRLDAQLDDVPAGLDARALGGVEVLRVVGGT